MAIIAEKVRLSPPPQIPDEISSQWKRWFEEVYSRLGDGPLKIKAYPVAGLPLVTSWGSTTSGSEFSSIIYVYDAAGGESIAWSNGVSWISARTGAAV